MIFLYFFYSKPTLFLLTHKDYSNTILQTCINYHQNSQKGTSACNRDDGLAVFKNARAGDRARMDFSKVIGDLGSKITVQSSLKVVDYLDVTLNPPTGKYYPFRKPDNDPQYINAKSSHLFLSKFQHP